MRKYNLAYVALDGAKAKHAVAIGEEGREGEVRYVGEIANSPDAVKKPVTTDSWVQAAVFFATKLDQRDMACIDN